MIHLNKKNENSIQKLCNLKNTEKHLEKRFEIIEKTILTQIAKMEKLQTLNLNFEVIKQFCFCFFLIFFMLSLN